MYHIIEEHRDFLLVCKHPGAGFHKDSSGPGLVDCIRSETKVTELFTVHRLDKITSGLLVFAKNRASAKKLTHQFRSRRAVKYYLAISDGSPKKKQGLIRGDMEKARRGAWKLARTMKDPAITQFFSYALGGGLRLYLLKPLTGKTHQLRVALKSIGAPVLGDPLYHRKEEGDKEIDRGYLHAYVLQFRLNNKTYRFVHPPDTGTLFTTSAFRETLRQCAKPWELKWPVLHSRHSS